MTFPTTHGHFASGEGDVLHAELDCLDEPQATAEQPPDVDRRYPWHSGGRVDASNDIDRLTQSEQLDLLDRLWESLGRDPSALPLSEEQQRDLDLRLDELERDGHKGVTWGEALDQIRPKAR